MKFKKGSQIDTSDFWYDMLDGGYIKPEKYLYYEKDVEDVKNAIQVLKKFKESAASQDIINDL